MDTVCGVDLLRFGHGIRFVGVIFQDAKSNQDMQFFFPCENSVEIRPSTSATLTLAEWLLLLEQVDTLRVEVDTETPEGAVRKAIVRKSQRQVDSAVSWLVYHRDCFRCRYCGRGLCPLTVDHLVRWEVGGPSTPANLVACCRKCNAARGDTEYPDWLSSSYYASVSRRLTEEERTANALLASTLPSIRRVRQRSR